MAFFLFLRLFVLCISALVGCTSVLGYTYIIDIVAVVHMGGKSILERVLFLCGTIKVCFGGYTVIRVPLIKLELGL